MTDIENDFCKVTGLPAQSGSARRQLFLTRMVRLGHDLSKDVWESLEEKTRAWLNQATREVNANTPITDPKDFVHQPIGQRGTAGFYH